MNRQDTTEWLETDGLGGYAMGPSCGTASRRYHGLLVTALNPPTDRVMLVNSMEVSLQLGEEWHALSSHAFTPDVVHPDGLERIEQFNIEPWPTWSYSVGDSCQMVQEVFMRRGIPAVFIRWRMVSKSDAPAKLFLRPLLSVRDYHHLQRANIYVDFYSEVQGNRVSWKPYSQMPGVFGVSNGEFSPEPDWYYNFHYAVEQQRGFDSIEDLACPGAFSWDLAQGEAMLVLGAEHAHKLVQDSQFEKFFLECEFKERKEREESSSDALVRAASSYVVKGETRTSIVAGYPWFTDWGRDTFIAIRGLCIASGLLEDAEEILLSWADIISEGMIPNRFPDQGEVPEFNSVDASLWFVVAAHDYLNAVPKKSQNAQYKKTRRKLCQAVDEIVSAYCSGTRYGIVCDDDGLLRVGTPGSQLTWMDATVDEMPITPRIGKPVEIQALWINSLHIANTLTKTGRKRLFTKAKKSFCERFWNEEHGYLFDVVDVGHEPGVVDGSFRCNQIFAVGGLDLQLLPDDQARRMVDAVEQQLLTPVGMRSLAPSDYAYVPYYEGGPKKRDGSYHQGTVWMWPVGAFVEAWVRVRGSSAKAKSEAKDKFLNQLLEHANAAGLGHFSEIFDAEPPYHSRGCPFQAWSLGEVLRLKYAVLKD